jgi:hypothetical protein
MIPPKRYVVNETAFRFCILSIPLKEKESQWASLKAGKSVQPYDYYFADNVSSNSD